jgi:hypothetical protein
MMCNAMISILEEADECGQFLVQQQHASKYVDSWFASEYSEGQCVNKTYLFITFNGSKKLVRRQHTSSHLLYFLRKVRARAAA